MSSADHESLPEALPVGTHADVLAWLNRDLDGELPARERLLLVDHLDGCPRCALVARQLRGIRRALIADRALHAPVGLVDRVMAHALEAPAMPAAMPAAIPVAPILPLLRRSAALAAALLLMVFGFYAFNLPRYAYAGSSKPSHDPVVTQVLERWLHGRRAEPTLLELLLPARVPSDSR